MPDGFEERLRLDVTHRAAHFDDDDVEPFRGVAHATLDLVGDVRNDLHRTAQIVAAAFLADHLGVDAAGGEVVLARHAHAQKPFVVAEVEVGLRAVGGDVDLTVLERAHRAWIDVDVRIHLHDVDLEIAGFENGRQRGGEDALSEGRNHTTGHENIASHECAILM